jgi:FKBP-type peptidyl-prolyl cis-trans isomerase
MNQFKWSAAVALVGLVVAVVACQQTEEAFNDRKTRENRDEIKAYLSANRITADSTRSGLFYNIQRSGATDQFPNVGDEVTVQYIARRFDGVVVDSSLVDSPIKYIRLPLSSANSRQYRFEAVPYLEEVIATGNVREGDRIALFVPWSLRGTVSASLLSPLYIPLRYDVKITNVRTEHEQIRDFMTSQKLTGFTVYNDSLLFKKTLVQPDSAAIKSGEDVNFIYTGKRVSDNVIFDSNTTTGAVFTVVDTVSTSNTVKGFNNAAFRMKYGEKAIVVFPSKLGYGSRGSGAKVPAYAPLYFELEVKRK